jgi:hypothetical protein
MSAKRPRGSIDSLVFSHFDYEKASASGEYNVHSCNYCGSFKRANCGVDAMRAHLSGEHSNKAKPCKSVPLEVQAVFKKDIASSSKRSGTQLTLGAAVDGSLRSTASEAIARWAFVHGVSFRAIDNDLFRAAMREVGKAGPSYKPPARKQIATTLLETIYDQTKQEVEAALEAQKCYGYSICSDGWTDVKSHTLINMMVMTAHGQFFLGSVDASDDVKSGEILAELMSRHIEVLGPQNVVCVVTDNASNCVVAGDCVQSTYPHISWLGCIPHCLSLLMKDLGKLSFVSKVVQEVSGVCFLSDRFVENIQLAHNQLTYALFMQIVSTVRSTPTIRNVFRKFSSHELLTLPDTRFAYSLIMLERFKLVKSSLKQTVQSPKWSEYKSRQYAQR